MTADEDRMALTPRECALLHAATRPIVASGEGSRSLRALMRIDDLARSPQDRGDWTVAPTLAVLGHECVQDAHVALEDAVARGLTARLSAKVVVALVDLSATRPDPSLPADATHTLAALRQKALDIAQSHA